MGDGGAMGGRTAAAGRQRQDSRAAVAGREMGSVHLLIFLILMREIFHILQESISR